MKAPDGGHVDGRARTHRHMDIGRARRYEHAGRQAGVRIPAAIAGARSAEQSAFIPWRCAHTGVLPENLLCITAITIHIHYIIHNFSIHNPYDTSRPGGNIIVMGDQNHRPALSVQLF